MTPRRTAPPLLELHDATVVRNGSELLRIERLQIAEGEKLALLGPNGSGKSMFIQLLTRDVHPVARGPRPSLLLRGSDCWDLLAARALFGIVSSALQETYAPYRGHSARGLAGGHAEGRAGFRRRSEG